MHEVNIEHSTNGHATIDLADSELSQLVIDWRSCVGTITAYEGFHRDYENGKDIVRPATLWIVPTTITSITADKLSDSL